MGLLLALAGGILDAYTYLVRGQVFATAETGNLVLLGINLSQGRLDQAAYYLWPILAFAAGVLAAELLRLYFERRPVRLHWRQSVVLAECLVLAAVSLIPAGGMDPAANVLISFTSAVQIESFRQFEGCGCATTMCTGNLRSGTELLFRRFLKGERAAGGKSRLYYGLILSFVTGAVLSGLFSGVLGERTVLIAVLPLGIAFAKMF